MVEGNGVQTSNLCYLHLILRSIVKERVGGMESTLYAVPYEGVIQVHGCVWWCLNIESALSAIDLRPIVKVRVGVTGICIICSPV